MAPKLGHQEIFTTAFESVTLALECQHYCNDDFSSIWVALVCGWSGDLLNMRWLPLTAALSAMSSIALAAEPAATGIISYPSSYFAEVGPTTAFDMVLRIPGFKSMKRV